MARHPFEGLEIMYEAQRLPRESAHHFKRKIREMMSIDEDYAHFLMLSLDYHKESTNEGGNEGPAVVRDKLNHGEYEDRDEDEVDPDYEEFLSNAEKYENSYLAKSGQSFECKAAEDDLQVIVGDNCTFGKEGSSILMDASSAKQLENVEDICPLQTVVSDFEWNVKALLERPYDQKEYIGLWKLVKSRTPSHLRNGKVYTTRRLGKSYLDHYKDLHKKLKEVDNDNRKKLNILRGFFFWLQEVVAVGGMNTSLKMGLKATDKQKESLRSTAASLGKGKQSKLSSSGLNVKMGRGRAARGQKVEPLVKGEGEMSDNDEVYEQFKEVKWMEWCEYVMMDKEKTLKRLQRLQTTTADLSKDKVLAKIRNYLQLLDRRIDQVVLEYEKEPHKQEKGKVGPSQFNGSAFGNPTTGFIPQGFDAAKFEAWKRRKRAEADVHSQVQPLHQRTLTNGACLPESNLSSGILGAAPLDNQQSGNGRAYRTHQSGLP